MSFAVASCDGALIAATRQRCRAATYRGIFPDSQIDGAVMTETDSGHENRQEDACYFEYYL